MGDFRTTAGPSLIEAGGSLAATVGNVMTASEQMRFQERMRSTAYQTAVDDMKKAGLNPAMMYGSAGPAAVPAGTAAEIKNPFEHLTEGLSTAADVNLKNKEAEKYEADTRLSYENQMTQVSQRLVNTAIEKKALAEAGVPAHLIAEIDKRIEQIEAQKGLTSAQEAKTRAETPEKEFFGKIFKKGGQAIENLENGLRYMQKKLGEGPKNKGHRGNTGHF